MNGGTSMLHAARTVATAAATTITLANNEASMQKIRAPPNKMMQMMGTCRCHLSAPGSSAAGTRTSMAKSCARDQEAGNNGIRVGADSIVCCEVAGTAEGGAASIAEDTVLDERGHRLDGTLDERGHRLFCVLRLPFDQPRIISGSTVTSILRAVCV
jgi:hypothetical protein